MTTEGEFALLLRAIIETDVRAVRDILKNDAALVSQRVAADRLIETIPHWLYAGDTALHLAAAALVVEAVAALLEEGADANASNRRGATPLHYACDPRPRSGGVWDPPAQVRIIEMLVAAGAVVDFREAGGVTPLHRAVRARSPEAVRRLLQLGASVRASIPKSGSTPMQLAMRSTGASGTKGTEAEQAAIIAALEEADGGL